ncbi:hypothetical protein GCM10017691_42030 [Pseudonocardia petroleophila]
MLDDRDRGCARQGRAPGRRHLQRPLRRHRRAGRPVPASDGRARRLRARRDARRHDRADGLLADLHPPHRRRAAAARDGLPRRRPVRAFGTADGHTVVLGTTNDAEWRRLARDLLGRPDLAEDPRYATAGRRVEHRAELDALVAAWCARTDLAAIQSAADAAGIGNSRYNTTSDVLAHPHLAARGRWGEVDTPGGPVPALLPPLGGRLDPVPALGEHTDAVLRELGVTDADIAALRADGVV